MFHELSKDDDVVDHTEEDGGARLSDFLKTSAFAVPGRLTGSQ